MWSETISLRTRLVWDQKIGLGLGLTGCAVKHDLVTLVIMILKDTATFQVLFIVSVLCLEHHYCGDQQWRLLTWKLNLPSAFVYSRHLWCKQDQILKTKTMVLVLRIWSCLHHWCRFQWPWVTLKGGTRGVKFFLRISIITVIVSLRMSEFWYDVRRNKFLRVSHVPHPKHAFSVTGLWNACYRSRPRSLKVVPFTD